MIILALISKMSQVYCTRPSCSKPENTLSEDHFNALYGGEQKYCTCCGMPLMLIGDKGNYIPLSLLSRGGFGRNFYALRVHQDKNKECVIKQFCPLYSYPDETLEQIKIKFQQEAKILNDLGSFYRQIPEVLDFCTLSPPSDSTSDPQEFVYLVQEYIDGDTLEQAVKKGTFSTEKVIIILKEMLRLLEGIHQKDIIHRDIKPRNIILKNERVYLIDFGAFKVLESVSDTHSKITPFTEGFAPPEQIPGETASKTVDLYAVAATCIYLLTKESPPRRNGEWDPNWQQWQKKGNIAPYYSILATMLEYQIGDRYSTAQDVLNALETPPASVLPTTPATPPTTLERQGNGLEALFKGGLTGLMGGIWGLIAIALASSLATVLINTGFWLLILLGLIFAQSWRGFRWYYLFIMAMISLTLVLGVERLRTLTVFYSGVLSLPRVILIVMITTAIGVLVISVLEYFNPSHADE